MVSSAYRVVLVLAVGVVAGCGGDATPGGASPQAVFDRAVQASAAGDWEAFYRCVDPASDALLFQQVVTTGFAAIDNESLRANVDAIGARHGLPDRNGRTPLLLSDPEAMRELQREMFQNVEDKAKLYGELVSATRQDATFSPVTLSGTLGNVRIEGTTAQATMYSETRDAYPIRFVQRDGVWYLQLME